MSFHLVYAAFNVKTMELENDGKLILKHGILKVHLLQKSEVMICSMTQHFFERNNQFLLRAQVRDLEAAFLDTPPVKKNIIKTNKHSLEEFFFSSQLKLGSELGHFFLF